MKMSKEEMIKKELSGEINCGEGICLSCGNIKSGYRNFEKAKCVKCGRRTIVPLSEDILKRVRTRVDDIKFIGTSTDTTTIHHVPASVRKAAGIYYHTNFCNMRFI